MIERTGPCSAAWFCEGITQTGLNIPIDRAIPPGFPREGALIHDMSSENLPAYTLLIELADGSVFTSADINGAWE